MFKYINFLLLAILLLIFSCDEEPKPVIEGCTIETACNYNIDATDDDDSCEIGEGCNQWCNGDEGEPQEFDCAFTCDGSAVEDECGTCDNDSSNDCVMDCANDWGGSKEVDVCGVCGGAGILFGKCDCDGNEEDCEGECGGSVLNDQCDICGGDNSTCTDCNDEINGAAYIDGCEDCVGGNTGFEECDHDCEGEIGGTSFVDNCDECVPAEDTSCVQGCDGHWENDGTQIVFDECDDCGGSGMPASNCDCDGNVEDCKGDCGGDAAKDECDVCGGDNSTCTDCSGEINGEAYIDGCEDCVGGNTGFDECDYDCADELGGTSFVDNCGECVPAGDTSCVQGCDGHWENDGTQIVFDECDICGGSGIPDSNCNCDGNVEDCTGECGGDAVEDDCDVCEGNNDDKDCAGVCDGDAEEDDCGDCEGNNDCFGCNDWYMENFICDDTEETDKCCVEDANNNDNRCKINGTGNNCEFSSYCRQEYLMECDLDEEYCDYVGAEVGTPCSTSEGSFTEGVGLCRKVCDIWNGPCFNITCNNSLLGEYCDYVGAEVGTPCSTSEGSFTEGVGLCVLDLSDDVNYSTGYITYYDTGCEDGTDSCCTEPECNEPLTLSLVYIDANTLQVNYSSTEAIGGFQFDVDGATVNSASGGDADANGFVISTLNSLVIGFSFDGSTIPAGQGILTNLTVTIDPSSENLCLQNVVISDPESNAINSCPEYWQLTCISNPAFIP